MDNLYHVRTSAVQVPRPDYVRQIGPNITKREIDALGAIAVQAYQITCKKIKSSAEIVHYISDNRRQTKGNRFSNARDPGARAKSVLVGVRKERLDDDSTRRAGQISRNFSLKLFEMLCGSVEFDLG